MPTLNSADGSVVVCRSGQPSSPQLQMLQKVRSLIGGQLAVDQVGFEGDIDWVKFHFVGVPDALVMMKLESNSNQLFTGEEIYEWQIMKSSSAHEAGIWLHHLSDISKKGECKGGVCYY